jgi:hypothetical protein
MTEMAIWPKIDGLTRDEIVFRVLLQREEAHAQLSVGALEESLPKQLRKQIEADWRSYIREEDLHFATAFQKAIRKHIPGLYYLVMAAEFLLKVPFHSALGHFLETANLPMAPEMERLFELADYLAEEIRKDRRNAMPRGAAENRSSAIHRSEPAELPTNIPPAARDRNGNVRHDPRPSLISTPKQAHQAIRKVAPSGPTKICAFCRARIPIRELRAHIDLHLNPPGIGGECYLVAPVTAARPTALARPAASAIAGPKPQNVAHSGGGRMKRFSTGRCIGCGNTPIPGDFYCYYCAPK